jgi:Sortase domain
MAGVAALATIAVAITGCSGQTAATVAQSVSATSRVAPSPSPVTSSTSQPVPSTTSPPASSTTSPRVVKAVRLARSLPVRLQIAAIGVDSTLMKLGLRADGSLEVPPDGFPAGWYTGGPTPGELGPAIIAGHIDMKGPGVFFRLREVRPGDRVTVTRADGSKPVFRVTRVAQFPKDRFPTELVFGNIDHAGLRVITCGGSFNSQTGHYEDNIVVFADLVAPAR